MQTARNKCWKKDGMVHITIDMNSLCGSTTSSLQILRDTIALVSQTDSQDFDCEPVTSPSLRPHKPAPRKRRVSSACNTENEPNTKRKTLPFTEQSQLQNMAFMPRSRVELFANVKSASNLLLLAAVGNRIESRILAGAIQMQRVPFFHRRGH